MQKNLYEASQLEISSKSNCTFSTVQAPGYISLFHTQIIQYKLEAATFQISEGLNLSQY